MAISIAGSTGGAAFNGGNITLTYPSGTNVVNNYALVDVTLGTSKTATLTVTTSSGAAFTQVSTTIQTGNMRFGVFRRLILSTGETTISVTGTGGSTDSTSATVLIFSGVDTTTPEDVAATSTGSGSNPGNPDSPSISVNSCGCAIITAVGTNLSNGTLTAPSSFLNATTKFSTDTNPSGNGQAWILYNSTAPINPAAWTSSVAVSWAAATVALRPSPFTWQDISVSSMESMVNEARRTVIASY